MVVVVVIVVAYDTPSELEAMLTSKPNKWTITAPYPKRRRIIERAKDS